jgi:hypothetical protein
MNLMPEAASPEAARPLSLCRISADRLFAIICAYRPRLMIMNYIANCWSNNKTGGGF